MDEGKMQREWDAQCARCGSSVLRDPCGACGGLGVIIEVAGDLLDEETETQCEICDGRGGWYTCLSGREWCEAHPSRGREDVPRVDCHHCGGARIVAGRPCGGCEGRGSL